MSPNTYGRAYASMFHRSMSGKGPLVISVWTYSFSHAYPAVEPDLGTVGHVELNPKIMAVLIGGCTPKEVSDVIEFLCSPDEESESKKEDGRRLVRLSQFKYRVVNFMEYREKVSDSPEAAAKRDRQERYIEKKKAEKASKLSPTLPSVTEPEPPIKALPESLNTPAFIEAWNDFKTHRSSKRKPVTEVAEKRLLKQCVEWGPEKSIRALDKAIANSWQGLFDPDVDRDGNPIKQPQDPRFVPGTDIAYFDNGFRGEAPCFEAVRKEIEGGSK